MNEQGNEQIPCSTPKLLKLFLSKAGCEHASVVLSSELQVETMVIFSLVRRMKRNRSRYVYVAAVMLVM